MSCYGCFWMAWSVRSCVRAAPSRRHATVPACLGRRTQEQRVAK